ncbi:MAG: hypothetical protein EOO03_13525, partial [Chitinophagaceae bacterium]
MKKSSADNGPGKGNLEEVFRRGLGQGEVTPRGDLWGKIDQQLDQQQTAGKYKRRAGYLALLSAFLLLLIGSVALYKLLPGFGPEQVVSENVINSSLQEIAANGPSQKSDPILERPETSASEGNLAENGNKTEDL